MQAWELLDWYFRDHPYAISQHQLDSYREFLRTFLPATIQSVNPITMVKNKETEQLQVDIYIGGTDPEQLQIYIDKPTMLEDGEAYLLTPSEARLRNGTYACRIFADITARYTIKDADGVHIVDIPFNRVRIGSVPIMLHSEPCLLHGQGSPVLRALGECPFDKGGYFIVDGKEKVIISQERIATNRLFIERSKEDGIEWEALIRCTGEGQLIPRTVKFAMMGGANMSKKDEKFRGAILVSIPGFMNNESRVPICTLFRAIGVETDRDIIECISGGDQEIQLFLRASLVHSGDSGIFYQQDAIKKLKDYVYFHSEDQVKSILSEDLFPNMGPTFHLKSLFLGHVVREFIQTVLGYRPALDRDGYMYKRIDLGGFLMAQLFQQGFYRFRNNCRDMLDREYHYGNGKHASLRDIPKILVRKENLKTLFAYPIIDGIMKSSLKGMWGTDSQDPEQGKVQDLSRVSYLGFISHIRRVNTPLDRAIKLVPPHRLHSHQWGIMCPFESPDGASIGYLKNFALMTHVTFGSDPKPLRIILFQVLGVTPLDSLASFHDIHEGIRIFLNGEWIGLHSEPVDLVHKLRLLRRNGYISPFLSVAWNIKTYEIRISIDAGRPCRPLLISENGKLLIDSMPYKAESWFDLLFGTTLPKEKRNRGHYYVTGTLLPDQDLINKNFWKSLEKTGGCIEFVDIEESDTLLIAMSRDQLTMQHTHCEIHPTTSFSVVTNNIPFANHNQAPRNIFFGAQSKQATSVYATNFSSRFDTAVYVQHYGQAPIVRSRVADYLHTNELPYGANAIVAIMSYTGFNQEDAIIINRAAIERGLFHTSVFKTMVIEEETLNSQERVTFQNPIHMRDVLGVPVENISKTTDYSHLDENGVVREETRILPYDRIALIGACHEKQELVEKQNGIFRESEVTTKSRDVSLVSDLHHYGVVDKVFVGSRGGLSQERVAKVRLRQVRTPTLGDKHSSRHGQKGVIGMILAPEDMPFTKDGVLPDLIINPHAFPSRMTIGHLVECVLSKLCCFEGVSGDGTSFLPIDLEGIAGELEKHGFEKHGNEILYNGKTGQQIQTEIFIGPTYYMRLKHMVADKMHSRDKGPRVLRTHQPSSGRGNDGGLRVGEMERDVLLGYGFSQFLKESMMEKSDGYRYTVCRSCGVIVPNAQKGCIGCKKNDHIIVVNTPYSFKLLVQELEALGLQLRLLTSPDV